jgi:hypothetical protein
VARAYKHYLHHVSADRDTVLPVAFVVIVAIVPDLGLGRWLGLKGGNEIPISPNMTALPAENFCRLGRPVLWQNDRETGKHDTAAKQGRGPKNGEIHGEEHRLGEESLTDRRI